jgi:GDP-D-mannose 3', 5'-epimerase
MSYLRILVFLVALCFMNFLCAEKLTLSTSQKTALVCGAGGFIGHHLVKQYKDEGYSVRGVDIKFPEFGATHADEFMLADLRYPEGAKQALTVDGELFAFDEVCQLAANMGGMGFISCHDAEIMHDSALINLTVLETCRKAKVKKIFFSSSACIYPERNQLDPENPKCSEDSAYPADPDTEYGWEKLFSERLYNSYANDYGMDVRIARLHNVFGPQGTWQGGREKAPAALCRKIAQAKDQSVIEVWGNGDQTRSFLYIDECIEGIRLIMKSEKKLPILNLGSEEMIAINDLVKLIAKIADKQIDLLNVEGPEGVRGRNSDNALIEQTLNWQPTQSLETGIEKLYPWIEEQVRNHQTQ